MAYKSAAIQTRGMEESSLKLPSHERITWVNTLSDSLILINSKKIFIKRDID